MCSDQWDASEHEDNPLKKARRAKQVLTAPPSAHVATKNVVNVATFDHVFAVGPVLANLVEQLLPSHMQDGGKSLAQFAMTCKSMYNNVDIKHALVSIHGIAELSAVALNVSVANHQSAMCPDDLCETHAAYILSNTIGRSIPYPPDGTYDTPEMQRVIQQAHQENRELEETACQYREWNGGFGVINGPVW
jgi:hypothetical protein